MVLSKLDIVETLRTIVAARGGSIHNVGGDCSIGATEAVRYGNIGGDLQIEGNASTVVAGGRVGGEVAITAAARTTKAATRQKVSLRRKRRRSIRSSALIAIVSLMGRWESTLLKQASAHGYRFLKGPAELRR